MKFKCLHLEPGPVAGCFGCAVAEKPRVVCISGSQTDAYINLLREAEKHVALNAFTKAVRDAGVTA